LHPPCHGPREVRRPLLRPGAAAARQGGGVCLASEAGCERPAARWLHRGARPARSTTATVACSWPPAHPRAAEDAAEVALVVRRVRRRPGAAHFPGLVLDRSEASAALL